MPLPRLWTVGVSVVAAVVLGSASPRQDTAEREKRARDYVEFLVSELDQWTRDFPRAYNVAMMRPPVDAARLSEPAKAAGEEMRAAVAKLAMLSKAQDLTTNSEFRAQLEKTLQAATPLNQALGAQRFPEAVESDWVPIRTALNSLADIYKTPELAVLETPLPGSGKSKNQPVPAGAIVAYFVDQRCSGNKPMWTNVKCVQTCLRDGDKLVLVTEQGKVMQITNPDKIDADNYGVKVAVTGKATGNTITVDTVQIL
jgi:hypothetical protein